MFKKLFASVGIGSATVDTVLETEQLYPGQPFNVVVNAKGGNVAQEIEGLTLALMTRVKYESDGHEGYTGQVIASWHLKDCAEIQPGEELSLPMELVLHPETPVTAIDGVQNECRVWLQTGLEIDCGVDASDLDYIDVLPFPPLEAFLVAMTNCGYGLVKMDAEQGTANAGAVQTTIGCYQEFEFRPFEGSGLFGINEIEATFIPDGDSITILIEIDRHFGGDSYKTLEIPADLDDETEMTSRLRALF